MTTALCHCIDCQKWSGSAYTTNVVVPRKDFKVIKGEPKHFNVKGDSGKMNDHWFCGGECFSVTRIGCHGVIGSGIYAFPVVHILFVSVQLYLLEPSACLNISHVPNPPTPIHPLPPSLPPPLTNTLPPDCGSSLYTELEVMPDAVCVKAGSIDDKNARDFKQTGVEFYTKDRMGFCKAVDGAEQKEVFG